MRAFGRLLSLVGALGVVVSTFLPWVTVQGIPLHLDLLGGNVTGLTDQLEKEGLVKREADPDDRRSFRVLLTGAGRRHFDEMAAEHERWLIEMFDGLGVANKDALYAQLGHLRVHLAQREEELDARDDPLQTNSTKP